MLPSCTRRVASKAEKVSKATRVAFAPVYSTKAETASASTQSEDGALKQANPVQPLPHNKLRALIRLYHESENFITTENLDDRIDLAFRVGPSQTGLDFTSGHQTIQELRAELRDRRMRPSVSKWEPTGSHSYSGTFNAEAVKQSRDAEVIHALYGMEKGTKPGLEALLEERERLHAMKKEDALAEHRAGQNERVGETRAEHRKS